MDAAEERFHNPEDRAKRLVPRNAVSPTRLLWLTSVRATSAEWEEARVRCKEKWMRSKSEDNSFRQSIKCLPGEWDLKIECAWSRESYFCFLKMSISTEKLEWWIPNMAFTQYSHHLERHFPQIIQSRPLGTSHLSIWARLSRTRTSSSLSLCLLVCAHFCIYVGACICMCTRRSGDQRTTLLYCSGTIVFFFFFFYGMVHWPKTWQIGSATWLQRPWYLPDPHLSSARIKGVWHCARDWTQVLTLAWHNHVL